MSSVNPPRPFDAMRPLFSILPRAYSAVYVSAVRRLRFRFTGNVSAVYHLFVLFLLTWNASAVFHPYLCVHWVPAVYDVTRLSAV